MLNTVDCKQGSLMTKSKPVISNGISKSRIVKMTLKFILNSNLWHLGEKKIYIRSDNSLSVVRDDILMLIRKRNNNFPIRRRFCLFTKQKRSGNFLIGRRIYKLEKSDFSLCRWRIWLQSKKKWWTFKSTDDFTNFQKVTDFRSADDILISFRKQATTVGNFFY